MNFTTALRYAEEKGMRPGHAENFAYFCAGVHIGARFPELNLAQAFEVYNAAVVDDEDK